MVRIQFEWENVVNRLFRLLAALVIGLAMLPTAAQAQDSPTPANFSQQDLDQLLAPIALYPDPLLSQILVAATYPLETVQAARFVRQNPTLKGDDLARALQGQSWDPSVKALAQFPSVLAMMDDQLAWTQKLGDAFLAQQGAVMDTVQALRARAQAAGKLPNNQQEQVAYQGAAIDIEPASPDTVYVPYYNPTVVYGNWWWPESPPFVWVPPQEYQPPYFGNYFLSGIAFGLGVGIVYSLFFPVYPDWGGHRFISGGWTIRNRPGGLRRPEGAVWAHDPTHRLGVAYHDAQTSARFQPAFNNGGNRDAYRGHPQAALPAPQPSFRQPTPDNHEPQAAMPHQPTMENRPAPQPVFRQPVEPVHPFMPTGPASTVQTHSERGQSSRATSSFGHADSHR